MAPAGERSEHLAAATGATRRAVLAAVIQAQQTPLRRRLGDSLDQLRGEGGPSSSGVIVKFVQVPRDRRGEAGGKLWETMKYYARCGGPGSEEPSMKGG